MRTLLEPPSNRGDQAGVTRATPAGPRRPTDRRPNPGPRAQQELEMLGYAFETLDEDVTECLAKWGQELPSRTDEVMIAFEIDKVGLQRAWVMDDAEIPFGPRTCFANAVYGIDWSHIVDHPAMVTKKFQVQPEDAGG